MNTFKRKSLYAAIAGLSTLGLNDGAQAVALNPDGLGQVLLYPYYTVRKDGAGNAFNSLISVVNTTDSTKAVKVRFLEGKNSAEVLDFNLILSKFDVWTAALSINAAGGGRITTDDHSCTIPKIPAGGKDFVNFVYFSGGTKPDKGGDGLDRTTEGYVELIEMSTYATGGLVAYYAHHKDGTPVDCTKLVAMDGTPGSPIYNGSRPTGGLFGGMSLINVPSGTDYTEDAVALQNFSATNIYGQSGSIFPDLSFVNPATSVVNNSSAGIFGDQVWLSNWIDPIDAVSATLMHDTLMNQYVVDASIKAGTNWVVTFPTKHFYTNNGTGNAPKLFQKNFNTNSCDPVALTIWDREEAVQQFVGFSPPPPGGTALCWEANVITFAGTNVLGSQNSNNVETSPFQSGWMLIDFFPDGSNVVFPKHSLRSNDTEAIFVSESLGIVGFSAVGTATYFGLPVIGFSVESYSNGSLTVGGASVLSNYGGNFVHRYTRFIEQ